MRALRIKLFFYLTFIAAVFLFFSSLDAQPLSRDQKFRSFSTRMGLSSNTQLCFVQDNEGFIWIGTMDGLNRFDGHNFKVYRKIPNDSTSLQSNVILSLCLDKDGVLWIGTSRGGLSRYNRQEDNFTNYRSIFYKDKTLASDIVTSVVEDGSQQLWVATYEGLNLLNKKTNQFTRLKYEPSNAVKSSRPAYNQISTMALDDSILWIGYYTNVISAFDLVHRKFFHYKLFDIQDRNVKEFFVTSICVDGDSLWISTWGKGVWIFDKKTHTCSPFEKGIYHVVSHIFKDKTNNIWIATESNGLLRVDKGKSSVIAYRHSDLDRFSLATDAISKVFQDKQGNIWIGNKKGDLYYLNPDTRFRVWRRNPPHANGLIRDDVTSILEDSQQRLWVGYIDGALEVFDLKGIRKKIIPGNGATTWGKINDLYESKDGTIWICTFLSGFKKYNEQTGSFISYEYDSRNSNSISCNNVQQIAEDERGILWLALHGGGLSSFNRATGEFKHYRVNYYDLAHTIISDWLVSLLVDKDNVWVGSVSGASVLNVKTNKITHYSNTETGSRQLNNDNVNVIFKDSKNYIWIGTNDGLHKIDSQGNILKIYNRQDGLTHNIISGLLEDDHYNLWVSTNQGLSKFSPGTGAVKNYFVEDGLETDDFCGNACFKNKWGEMYFGGIKGLSVFHPDSLPRDAFSPPVYLTDFKLFNKSVPVKPGDKDTFSFSRQVRFLDEITLAYDQNIITFEFVALDYLNVHKIQYAYKLEGFDKTWTNAGGRHEASYTNLHPGEYTFMVKASNGDGKWNTKGDYVKIIVEPPYWKTTWAYTLYVILFALFLYAFWVLVFRHATMVKKLELEELEIKKLQKIDAQKMDFFSNISHEFRTPLTLIVGPLENLMKAVHDEGNALQLKIIYRNATRLLRLINQLMDFSKLEGDELKLETSLFDIAKFTTTLSLSFLSEAVQRNIDFKINSTNDLMVGLFDRDKLEKILYNIIGNAFKFTPDHGRITISLSLYNQYKGNTAVRILVEDSGLGIAKEYIHKIFDRFYQVGDAMSHNQGTGIGLALAKQLTELHGGEIKVESEPGLGSRFNIILPLRPEPLPSAAARSDQDFIVAPRTKLHDAVAFDHVEVSATSVVHDDRPLLLIIDDHADMRLFIRHEFSAAYNVIEASDGAEGFGKACNEVPDIIICDVMMPRTDGMTLCRNIRSNVITSHIPIILLTAKVSDKYALDGLYSGANDYISKPFVASILKVKVKNLIALRHEVANSFTRHPAAALQTISPTPLDEKFLKQAYDIVEKNLGNPNLDVDAFSLAIGMSRAQLYRKIQMLSGQSVKEFIRIIRLKKATEMLLKSELNISQIAFEVGFSSVAYFTKSFSSYFGVTPSKYISVNKGTKDSHIIS